MATLFLCIIWSVMLVKTFLVADNVSERHGHAAIMRWLSAQWKWSRESSELPSTTHRLGNANASRFRCENIDILPEFNQSYARGCHVDNDVTLRPVCIPLALLFHVVCRIFLYRISNRASDVAQS